MNTKKPIYIGQGSYIVDSDFNIIKFTKNQATTFARKSTKSIEKRFNNGYKFSQTNIKDCGDHWSISRQ